MVPSTEEKVEDCFVVEKKSNETKPCIIPFIYQERLFNGCTDFVDIRAKPWCSTEVNENGEHIIGQGTWGECKDVCEMDRKGKLTSSNGMSFLRSSQG